MSTQNARSYDDTPPTINSEWVRCLMTFRRISSAEIARRVGVEESTVRKAINNLGPIDRTTKQAVVRALSRALRRRVATLCIDRVAA